MQNVQPARHSGLVLAARTGGNWRLLVLHAAGCWDFPHGPMGEGEDPLVAAQRNTSADTGIDGFDVPDSGDYRETVPYAAATITRYYLACGAHQTAELPIRHETGTPRHNQARWVSFDEAEELLPPRLALVLDWVRSALDR